MDIKELAIEFGSGFNTYDGKTTYFFMEDALEAFAKALQPQSEPVAEKWPNGMIIEYEENDYGDPIHLPIGTKFYTDPPNTVSREQYDKLLEALKTLVALKEQKDTLGKVPSYMDAMPIAWDNARQAIAEAEER